MTPLLDRSLDPLFWPNLRAATPSAWHGHVPFAHWIVPALKPRLLVELGTHAGVSYAAFCQGVQRTNLPTQCVAVDSWAGDDHAGAYSEDVFTELSRFHDATFPGFSRMLRKTFDDAVGDFEDGTIDLLHIDGFHSYEAVSHDFHTWLPKLSDRAVVLFHDTHVRERGFGVWKFWEEIQGRFHGSLEFVHSFGLGVLVVGPRAAGPLLELCAAPVTRVRPAFETLGRLHGLEYERVHRPAEVPDEPMPVAPLVDETLPAPELFVAERFVAPPGLHAVSLPRDAVTRGAVGCSVWVISPDGRDWRQGEVGQVPDGDVTTLVFRAFDHAKPQHFHVLVTTPAAEGHGLPAALAEQIGHRRPPIALGTPAVTLPALPPHRLYPWVDGQIVGAPAA